MTQKQKELLLDDLYTRKAFSEISERALLSRLIEAIPVEAEQPKAKRRVLVYRVERDIGKDVSAEQANEWLSNWPDKYRIEERD